MWSEPGGDPAALASEVRGLLRGLDPELPLADVLTLDDIALAANGQRRFLLAMIGLFSAAAILLAMVGAYGVLTWTVQQRSREMGIRVALGAQRSQVLSLVVGQGLWLGLGGLAGGLFVALAAGRVLQRLLYGVSPRDVSTFVTVALVMLVLSAVAAFGPAWAATRTNPVEALRLD